MIQMDKFNENEDDQLEIESEEDDTEEEDNPDSDEEDFRQWDKNIGQKRYGNYDSDSTDERQPKKVKL